MRMKHHSPIYDLPPKFQGAVGALVLNLNGHGWAFFRHGKWELMSLGAAQRRFKDLPYMCPKGGWCIVDHLDYSNGQKYSETLTHHCVREAFAAARIQFKELAHKVA